MDCDTNGMGQPCLTVVEYRWKSQTHVQVQRQRSVLDPIHHMFTSRPPLFLVSFSPAQYPEREKPQQCYEHSGSDGGD